MKDPIVRIERVLPDSGAQVGACFPLQAAGTVFGRDPRCDVVLMDPRVSRTHVRFSLRAEGWVAESLSKHALYVNEVAAGASHLLKALDYVQIGGVLVRVYAGDATETRTAPPIAMEPTTGERGLVLHPSTCEARAFGAPLVLQPGPFAALLVLARRPGEWVTSEDIAAAVWPDRDVGGPEYVNKYVSYVRAGLADAISGRPDAAEAVRKALLDCADPYTDMDPIEADLLREFVKGRKKVGYRIHLRPTDVRIAE